MLFRSQRLYARPQGGQGPEEILERESTLTSRLKEAARVETRRRGGSAEKQDWEEGRRFGGVIIQEIWGSDHRGEEGGGPQDG